MIEFDLKQNTTKNIAGSYGKYYAEAKQGEIYDRRKLAEYIKFHNTTYSVGELLGVLEELSNAIMNLLADGKTVKLDDLVILKVAIDSVGIDDPNTFDQRIHIKGVHLRTQATGQFASKNLKNRVALERCKHPRSKK